MADDQRERRTREEAIASAGRHLASSMRRLEAMTPREHAEAAHRPGGPSIDELEQRIRARRERHTGTAGATAASTDRSVPSTTTPSAPPPAAACPGPHHRLVYSVDQAAEQLPISTTVLWELIRAGDVPTITYASGRRRRGITHAALLRWIAGREHAAGMASPLTVGAR